MWEYFCEVKRGKLNYTEIKSWSEMTQTPLKGIEVDIIMKMDAAFERALHE